MSSSQTKSDDFCLECHWEAFHLDGNNNAVDSSRPNVQSQWACSGDDHHGDVGGHCNFDDACCDLDDCTFNCSSICDGFLDCDDSIICSVRHCEEKDCNDTGVACFDEHCFGDVSATGTDYGFGSLLAGSQPPFTSLGGSDPLPIVKPAAATAPLYEDRPTAGANTVDPSFFGPYVPRAGQYHWPYHHECQNLTATDHNNNNNNNRPAKSPEAFCTLPSCPDFSNCLPSNSPRGETGVVHCTAEQPQRTDGNPCCLPPACFHHHPNGYAKNSIGSTPNKHNHNHNHRAHKAHGPCRVHQHRCQHHAHLHSHPYSPLSRQSRGSVSSYFLSSPGDTPPPLEDGSSSLLTSPEFTPEKSEPHICKWTTTNIDGVRTTCDALFFDEAALQEHLVSKHTKPVMGAKGTGFYCCWEGCHRPDEPFSQKSKLQGHFLTHSNREFIENI